MATGQANYDFTEKVSCCMYANAFDEDMKKSIESEINGHMVKPIDVPRLKKMLAECLSLEEYEVQRCQRIEMSPDGMQRRRM